MKALVMFFYICNMLCFGLHYYNVLQSHNYKIKITSRLERFFLGSSLVLIISSAVIITIGRTISSERGYFVTSCFLLVYFMVISVLYLMKRNKYIFTPRAFRMYLLYTFLSCLSCGIIFIRSKYLFYSMLFLLLTLNPLISYIAYKITLPFENWNNKKYIAKAKYILDNHPYLVKIGITGSFGKTSCKKILYQLLAEDYNTKITKASYNTPLGVAIATEEIEKHTDIFIAEMGARYVGDIKELIEMVKPCYAIVTGITRQHLETFKSIKNIYKEKKELADSVPPNGFCVFNGSNSYTKYMYNQCRVQKCLVGFCPTCDIYAENISSNLEGSSFDIVYDSHRLSCTTKLLGKHNVLNILLAFAMARKLNISSTHLQERIAKLRPIDHRMQPLRSPNGILIIDDSYNCNIEGALAAMEVIKTYAGRKVVFSQGIVEVGTDKQHDLNKYLGRIIAQVADQVILCGINALSIKQGLLENQFKGEVRIYRNLKKAKDDFKNVLKYGDLLLIQNDLPDNI